MIEFKIRRLSFTKLIRRAGSFFYVFIFSILILVAVILLISAFDIPGNYKVLTVESGSMEPAVKIGSIVITKSQKNYQKNDIITVSDPANPKVSITHRIVEIEKKDGNTSYITKGDANEDPDAKKRLEQNIIGKTLFSVPFIGYLVDFVKTKNGLLAFIIIPSVLIIYNEFMNIKKETINIIKKRRYV